MENIYKIVTGVCVVCLLVLGYFFYTAQSRNAAIQMQQAQMIEKLSDQIASSSQQQSDTPSSPSVSAQSLSSLQNQCANLAYQLFSSGNYVDSNVATDGSYRDHYSISKGKCYVEISFDGPTYFSIELYDALEANLIGTYTVAFDSSTGQMGAVRECQVNSLENNCSSLQGFANLESEYMSN